jgi:hypothetical protein
MGLALEIRGSGVGFRNGDDSAKKEDVVVAPQA